MTLTAEEAIRFDRHPGKPEAASRSNILATSACSPYPFAYARTALNFGLRSLGIASGESVLVPAFTCEALIEPLRQLGIEPQFYPVDASLHPRWQEVETCVTTSTKALIVIHYFGQPQDVDACRTFCQQHDLLLIEDNAHGFGASYNGQLLGTFGSIGIASPRKTFPIRNGALLYAADESRSALDDTRCSLQLRPESSGRGWAKQQIRSIPFVREVLAVHERHREARRRRLPPPDYHSQEAFREAPLRGCFGMDQVDYDALMCEDVERARTARQELYSLWQEWGERRGLEPVFPEMLRGSMPLVFPAFVPDKSSGRYWFERGHRLGIDIHSWPTLPQEVCNRDQETLRLWERMVCFPIHQNMNADLLKQRIALL